MYIEPESNILKRLQDSAHELSSEAWNELYRQYASIPNTQSRHSEKWFHLKSLGLDDEKIEKLCAPRFNKEDIMKDVAESSAKEHRKFRRWDKQRRLEEQQKLKDVSATRVDSLIGKVRLDLTPTA